MYEEAGAVAALEVFVQAGVDHRETPQMHEKVMAFFQRELRPDLTTDMRDHGDGRSET